MRRCSVHRSFSATPSNRCLFHPCTSLVTYPLQNIPLPMYIKGAPWMCDMTHKHVWHDSFAFFFLIGIYKKRIWKPLRPSGAVVWVAQAALFFEKTMQSCSKFSNYFGWRCLHNSLSWSAHGGKQHTAVRQSVPLLWHFRHIWSPRANMWGLGLHGLPQMWVKHTFKVLFKCFLKVGDVNLAHWGDMHIWEWSSSIAALSR